MAEPRLRQTVLENLIFGMIWLVTLVLPVFIYAQGGIVFWSRVFNFWILLLPFFALFLVNNYLLVPRFLLRKRWGWYCGSVLALIAVLFSAVQPAVAPRMHLPMKEREIAVLRERLDADSLLPTPWMRGRDMPFLLYPGAVSDSVFAAFGPGLPGRPETTGEQPPSRKKMFPGDPMLRMPAKLSVMFNDWLIAILVVGFNLGIHYIFKSIRDERQIRELEATSLQAELNYLKAQINPHFFMNTLNNIHALVDIDAEKAKETVIELSKIMRYVLYEADQQGIQLYREIQFIENYVSLMRIRFSDEIDIRMDFPHPVPDVRIPPMMLVTLLENAFKHGISYRRDSYIHMRLTIGDGLLTYEVENSVGEKGSSKPGVGMENMRKRLNLLYGGEYSLEFRHTLEKYTITLTIPVMQ